MASPKPTPRVRMPATAKAGEVIEVKTLISHEMESGQRKDAAGQTIPRKIIKAFQVTFNGKEVMSADWHAAISANPYQSFFVKVPETGHLRVHVDRRRRLHLHGRTEGDGRLSADWHLSRHRSRSSKFQIFHVAMSHRDEQIGIAGQQQAQA